MERPLREVVERYERIWQDAESTGRDDEEVMDLYEDGLAKAGLL
ncbi:hypothetical protein [Pseudonocardia sp. ICBG601]|nr:hypothetical protein [Pseudonocardia sp. ICBG601]